MKGTIDFQYDDRSDVVIARPRWLLDTAVEITRWYKLHADYFAGRFHGPKDLITLHDGFDVATKVAPLWDAYSAKLHESCVRFSVRVRTDPGTGAAPGSSRSLEAPSVEAAIGVLLRLRGGERPSLPPAPASSPCSSRRTLPQFGIDEPAKPTSSVRERRTSEVAVLRREIVDTDGRSRQALQVFCPRDVRSMPRDACSTCALYQGDRDGGAYVKCGAPPVDGPASSVSSIAESTPLGLAMESVRCVAADVPASQVVLVMQRGPVIVVDERGAPLGLAVASGLPPPAPGGTSVARIPVVEEREVLAKALNAMAASHGRHVCVVDREGVAIGLISDIAAMRWLARRRAASTPPPETLREQRHA